jgi:hypothetical protein
MSTQIELPQVTAELVTALLAYFDTSETTRSEILAGTFNASRRVELLAEMNAVRQRVLNALEPKVQ